MKLPFILVTLMLAAAASAGDVYKTTDQQGRPVYTDKPPTLPAQRMHVESSTTDVVEAKQRYDEQMKRLAESDRAGTDAAAQAADERSAAETSAGDRAKRCQDARDRYQSYMTAQKLYVTDDSGGERRYLSAEEIDTARANAKKMMDDFCGGQ